MNRSLQSVRSAKHVGSVVRLAELSLVQSL